MSCKSCVVTRSAGLAVAAGSMISSGKRAVSQCDTEEPGCTVGGAYICTWPDGWRPLDSSPLAATTAGPVQWRSPVSRAEAARSPSVICGHVLPVL
jgi:hypothetical protein